MRMRLESVELTGFKSFCDKQALSFTGGVTGIVGPNGCGKSNISDAISWVLGEQSVKSLRGSSMEDVIFAGSQTRQPLGLAEVNLRISGLNGDSPDGLSECIVTRRLYRSGESEYLMNGQACRLRDIHEMFMDTGLGSKAYAIIEQGKIGLILSSKPADRRALIEEAAGITKYKVRRRQTALKLEAAQQNLLRVNDIIHEVEKQLDSLKRQASKARRYRILRDELRGFERVLFGRRFLELDRKIRSLNEQIEAESDHERSVGLVLETEDAQLAARRSALYEEEANLEQQRSRQNELTLGIDRQQARSGFCKEQISETATREADLLREADDLSANTTPLAEALAGKREEHLQIATDLRQAENGCTEAETLVAQNVSRQMATEAMIEESRGAQIELLGRIAALQNTGETARASADRASNALIKLGAEIDALRRERARADELVSESRRRATEGESRLFELKRRKADTSARETEAWEQVDRLSERIESFQSERDSLTGRLASLEEIVATHSAFDEGVRVLLTQRDNNDKSTPVILGVVADCVETDSLYERALEAFLGDRLQALLTPDQDHALRGVRCLEESGSGRGTFLPLDASRIRSGCSVLREIARQEHSVKGLLSDFYRVVGSHAEQIRAAFPDALLVETLEQACDIVSRQGHLPFVTLSGETLRGGLVEGGRGIKGLLSPRREIREVRSRLEELKKTLAELRQREEQQRARAKSAQDETRVIDESIHTAEKDLVAVQHDLASTVEESSRLERKSSILQTESQQLESERAAALERVEETERALASAQIERKACAEKIARLANDVVQWRSAVDAAQARSSDARSTVATLRERLSGCETELRRLEHDNEELLSRITSARHRAEDLSRRREELSQELADSERRITEGLLERDRVLKEVGAIENRVRDLRNELEGREHAIKERRREHGMLKDVVSELGIEKARVGSDLDHLARECWQSLQKSAAEAAASLSDDDIARDLGDLASEIEALRQRLDRMGPVNVLAVEQLEEQEQRYDFLTTQRQDLLDSIAELDQAIKKIDRTSRERFQEAFETINQHFGEVFHQLFGGGTAGLSLIDEENLLESGIDVMAQPPGKRLQNVLLLSGGEKALTAIALLFAIFQYKPSPFCILDEVDAPLDDANIGRFLKMLDGLKHETQFVLITHSRRTMEIADHLYGVTMEEPGVSKLVSVRFA
jgi:chromosome segregation protein